MNTLKKILLSFGCVLVSLMGYAQSSRTPMDDMADAIKNNHVSDMMKFFDARVPVTINTNQAVYSRNQAEVVLKDFFDRNDPKDFAVVETGAPNKNSTYLIGNFTCPSGNYSVYIQMRVKDKGYILEEMRLNKE